MARPLASDIITRYEEAKTIRSPHENDWKMAAAYCLPRQYGAWNVDGPSMLVGQSKGQAARRVAFDTTGTRALPKYMAILERMITPHNMVWQTLAVSDRNLARSMRVRNYFDELNSLLFRMRYDEKGKFKQASSETYASIGVYGMGPIFYGRRRKSNQFLYRACSMRDIYVLVNDEGDVDTVFYRFWLNRRQFAQKFPGEQEPPCMKLSVGAAQKETDMKEFVHVVHPRTDYDPEAIDARRHPYVSSYICVTDRYYIGEEQGFKSMPYLTPRTFTEAGDPYGFAPAAQALGALGTASAMKKSILKVGQRIAEPTLLVHDDGVTNGVIDLRPNASIPGGLDNQGRMMVQPFPVGDLRIPDKLLEEERMDINDSFFVTIFQILMETPEMTATEVMERMAEKTALMAPTMGRLQSEFTSPGVLRELDMLDEMGLMPQMPPELIEARGEYDILHTSPMAKGMYAEEVSGFMRIVEMATNLVNVTQDPSHFDHFNFDAAIPEISERMAVPARWMNDDRTKSTLATARQQQQQQAELLKNAAPLASAAKTLTAQGAQ